MNRRTLFVHWFLEVFSMRTGRSALFVKGVFVDWNTRVSCEAVTVMSSLAGVIDLPLATARISIVCKSSRRSGIPTTSSTSPSILCGRRR